MLNLAAHRRLAPFNPLFPVNTARRHSLDAVMAAIDTVLLRSF
jgi:hypothetical protein